MEFFDWFAALRNIVVLEIDEWTVEKFDESFDPGMFYPLWLAQVEPEEAFDSNRELF